MGAFFTNIQLLSPGIKKAALVDKVIKHITGKQTKKGYQLTDEVEEIETATIISAKGTGMWIGIYDEETETQQLPLLQKSAAQLSKKFKTTALAILVNDSDTFCLEVFVNGVSCSRMDNFSGEPDFMLVNKEPWIALLKNEFSFDDIVAAWKNKTHFVEDFLKDVSSFLNIDTENALTGYNYRTEEKDKEFVKLNFKDKNAPAKKELGLVRLGMFSAANGIQTGLNVGDEFNSEWVITNSGSNAKGLRIVITGTAILSELLKPVRVEMEYYNTNTVKIIEFTIKFQEGETDDKQKVFIAELPDLIIKGGSNTVGKTLKQLLKGMKDSVKSAMIFRLNFTVVTKGEGQLLIWFMPLENLEDGSFCSFNMDFKIE